MRFTSVNTPLTKILAAPLGALMLLVCTNPVRDNPFDSAGVNWNPPVLTAHGDTAVSFATTTSVTVTVSAGRMTGKYYWDIGANGWDDSTDAASYTVTTASGGTVTVRWAARDEAGVMSVDTFDVLFNRPPSTATVSTPASSAAWVNFSPSSGKGTLPITLSSSDADGVMDTLVYTLFMGPSAASLTQVYTGDSTQYSAANIDSNAIVFWRVRVQDLFGDSAVSTGTFVAPPAPPSTMAFIAGGTFQMGSATGEADEQPVHDVTVSSFWMDTTEVTQADYLALMGVNPSYLTDDTKRPVEKVTWFDAALYCNKRGRRDGKDTVYTYSAVNGTAGDGCYGLTGLTIDYSKNGYRLPTEAEWEYACRAGTTTEYFWEDRIIDDYAWYSGNCASKTHAAATRLPNAWGLYDMIGNVREWCGDWRASAYTGGAQTDPTGPATGAYRILRGGSWYDDADSLRTANRFSSAPGLRFNTCGFRVVCPRN